jgi:hypothetical protein
MVVIMLWASWIMCFFSAVTVRTWLLNASDRAVNNCNCVGTLVSRIMSRCSSIEVDLLTYLCLSGFPVMVGYTNVVKQAVQLANDGVDLL